MIVAVASNRPTEIEAVKEAWKVFSESLVDKGDAVEFVSYGIAGDIRSLPLNQDELMSGARSRAESLILQLKRERVEADYYVGLQSGFQLVNSQGPRRLVFLASWVYVTNGHKGWFGHGPGLVVPSKIADQVIDRGIDLNIVLDRFAKEAGLVSEEGPWECLSRDILSGRHSFVLALISAFAPFYNPAAFS
jgi:non-canonical (house-cleaning) NTP pyrophosphatase